MIIRIAKISDYEELMNLYNLLAEEDRYTNKNFDSFNKVLEQASSYIYVAEEENILIGFAAFSIRYVIRYPNPIATLDELFVLENHRKQGIGKKFIDLLEAKSKELNCISIYIESRLHLKIAHKFYQRLGYKKGGYYFKKDI